MQDSVEGKLKHLLDFSTIADNFSDFLFAFFFTESILSF